MSTLSHSVKFSDQPYSQNQQYEQHVSDLDEAANQNNVPQSRQGYRSQAPPPSHNQYEEYQNSYRPPHLNNYSTYQPASANIYSPHYQHHARMQQQQDIEKQFNYSGSRLRSPHHNPASKVEARLRQGLTLDSQYNQGQGNDHNFVVGEHCPEHCPHDHGKDSYYYSQSRQPTNKSKLMQYAQPYGSGLYTDQLAKRNIHTKTANNFYSTNGKRQAYTSHEGSRKSLNNTNNSTTFNSIMQQKRVQEKLREKLYFDERTKTVPKTTIKNGIIEDIVSEGDVFQGNKQLMNSVFKLKSLHLLKQHESHVNRQQGIGKFPFVFNDYHSKSTNNGYSRQEKGGFFFTR